MTSFEVDEDPLLSLSTLIRSPTTCFSSSSSSPSCVSMQATYKGMWTDQPLQVFLLEF